MVINEKSSTEIVQLPVQITLQYFLSNIRIVIEVDIDQLNVNLKRGKCTNRKTNSNSRINKSW